MGNATAHSTKADAERCLEAVAAATYAVKRYGRYCGHRHRRLEAALRCAKDGDTIDSSTGDRWLVRLAEGALSASGRPKTVRYADLADR